jgi:acyl-CoA synthetase (AMP-forming)/AMP-acid ligase II
MADGELYVTGRKKDLIICGGRNIYPQDLEEIAGEVEGVHPGRVVAFGIFDENEGTELIAIIAEADDTSASSRRAIAEGIRKAVGERSTVSASFVDVVDRKWMIKTSSGKIPRAANREKWLAEGRFRM